MNSYVSITKELLEYNTTLDPADLFPVVIPQAAELIVNDPYAFCFAACLNRGTKAEIIWTIPYDFKNLYGHLDPYQIYKLRLTELVHFIHWLPRMPRYKNDAPRTIYELTQIVVEECDGDASKIWKDKRADDVKRTFTSIHGVGEGIANMAVLLIEAAFKVRFSDLDHTRMDIKPDVHTKRVLFRLGVSKAETEQAAIEAARLLHPAYPGELDGALWIIGRKWCHPINLECPQCPMTRVCTKNLL
jgi:endonuclease III